MRRYDKKTPTQRIDVYFYLRMEMMVVRTTIEGSFF